MAAAPAEKAPYRRNLREMSPTVWIGFLFFVVVMVVLDLGVFHRKAHAMRVGEALAWTGFWILLALAFNVLVFFLYDKNWTWVCSRRLSPRGATRNGNAQRSTRKSARPSNLSHLRISNENGDVLPAGTFFKRKPNR